MASLGGKEAAGPLPTLPFLLSSAIPLSSALRVTCWMDPHLWAGLSAPTGCDPGVSFPFVPQCWPSRWPFPDPHQAPPGTDTARLPAPSAAHDWNLLSTHSTASGEWLSLRAGLRGSQVWTWDSDGHQVCWAAGLEWMKCWAGCPLLGPRQPACTRGCAKGWMDLARGSRASSVLWLVGVMLVCECSSQDWLIKLHCLLSTFVPSQS